MSVLISLEKAINNLNETFHKNFKFNFLFLKTNYLVQKFDCFFSLFLYLFFKFKCLKYVKHAIYREATNCLS